MNWNAINLHNNSYEDAFEAFCIQLFEHYLKRTYSNDLADFYAISGSGGDGGVEAFGFTYSKKHLGLQAKWFLNALKPAQVRQIKESILTALKVRPELTEYIICLPKRVNSKRETKSDAKEAKDEKQKLDHVANEIRKDHPELKITWWFENELLSQLQFPDCLFIEAYWFGESFLTLEKLQQRFNDQRNHTWLKTRYVPELNAQGIIAEHYDELCMGDEFKSSMKSKLEKLREQLYKAGTLIDMFVGTIENDEKLIAEFERIQFSFQDSLDNIAILDEALENNILIPNLKQFPEYYLWNVKMRVDENRPTNIQLPFYRRLSNALDEIHKIHIHQYLGALSDHFQRRSLLFLGGPGTGKTHGLAHCTKNHLKHSLPAIMIPAKGTPCDNWTQLLSSALEWPTKNADEILTALEALAIIELHQQASGKSTRQQPCFAIICIDGLEEDAGKRQSWYNRVNDTKGLTERFARVRFIFSARDYFNDHDLLSERVPFEKISLPSEGDVTVREAAEIYFAGSHYNITNVNDDVMNRIENLYALRLFCDLYEGKDLAKKSDVLTDLRSLLAKKIEVLNAEFRDNSERYFSNSSLPVTETLRIIASQFYTRTKVERKALLSVLKAQVQSLSFPELERMLDFLTEHGLLTAGHVYKDDILGGYDIIYYVTYQSIIEHVITEEVYQQIIEGKLDRIPRIVMGEMVAPLDKRFIDPEAAFPNETILESILKRVFLKTGKLVGENGFLSEGLQPESIPGLQMAILAVSNKELGQKYDELVSKWLNMGYWHQQNLYIRLIRPAVKLDKYFNAQWLHEKIIALPSVYERDKFLWADRKKRKRESFEGLEAAIFPFQGFDTSLYPFDKFHQEPLIYAWCLSSPNRAFRRELRSSLLNWAGLNIPEWIKLLSLMTHQDDTQILEDLASVTLGLSHKLREDESILLLAKWSIKNIFLNDKKFFTSRIREGFRSIVERSAQTGLLPDSEAKKARPTHRNDIIFIELNREVLKLGKGEFYPIASDLSWYVIDDAYEPFIENVYPPDAAPKKTGSDVEFLKAYAQKYKVDKLSGHLWSVAAAISFIRRQFGFQKKTGHLTFLPSHGEKGEIMLFEEKYVWQSVYYLQAYLSEQLKLVRHDHYLESYSSVTQLPNPSEGMIHTFDEFDDFILRGDLEWIIPENLVHTMPTNDTLVDAVKKEIDGAWNLNIPSWLEHTDANENRWTHLYNKIQLEDKNGRIYGRLKATAILVAKDQIATLLEVLHENPKALHFIRSLDSLKAYPDADHYNNPSDIIANKFVNEGNSATEIYIDDDEYNLEHTIVKVTQSDLNNELFHYVPSRLIRRLTGITEMKGERLRNEIHQLVGFANTKVEGRTENEQKLTAILSNILEQQVISEGYELIWFTEVFKRTTLSTEKDGVYLRRTRKYATWKEAGQFRTLQIWNKESSN